MKKLNVVHGNTPAPSRLGPPKPQGDVAQKVVERGSKFWRSLEDKLSSPSDKADEWKEHPEGADELVVGPGGVSRRRFFGMVGSGAALAGMTTATGCIRKPKEHILPFNERPEDMIPGKPMFYASAFQHGASVEGLLVESHDGRPIKIEGNPNHSGSQGATSIYAQASILDLYDPDRSRVPMKAGEPSTWKEARKAISDLMAGAAKKQGAGISLVVPTVMSPSQRAELAAFRRKYPQAKLFICDPEGAHNSTAAAEMVGKDGARYRYSVDGVKVVASFDADFLGRGRDSTRLSKEWAAGRRVVGPTDQMSRLYSFEAHLSCTGVMADHRRRVKSSQVGDVLIALAKEVFGGKYAEAKAPAGFDVAGLPAVSLDERTTAVVNALAKDLAESIAPEQTPEERAQEDGASRRYRPLRGSAIIVGERQPVWVHALALALNSGLRNTGTGVRWNLDSTAPKLEPIDGLPAAIGSGPVICLGTNPAYDAPGHLGVAAALANATVVHIGLYRDETGANATWHLPVSHYLEAWNDLASSDGTTTICQPLIEPLHDTFSELEFLHYFATGKMERGSQLLQGYWRGQLRQQFNEKEWRRWLHDGVVEGAPRNPVLPTVAWDGVGAAISKGRKVVEGMEVNVHLDPRVSDGRYGNNAWLAELPHPITKVSWDNVASMSPATAAAMGVSDGDMVTVSVDGGSLTLPAFQVPGQADDTVSVTLGGGRKILRWDGSVAVVSEGAGFNGGLVASSAASFQSGQVSSAGGTYPLANTQDYGSLKPPGAAGFDFPERPIVLEATVDEFNEDPNFVEKANLMPQSRLEHLWEPPALTGKQQWGMSVDLNTCSGCMSCVVACQAENNIPIVGKEQVINGRELHWMRLDRYYGGDEDEPTAVVQPMFCQHCEAAPCETVCPVAATVHSPEGLNEMVYNRCIGTRYCSNNCPYKVRRYNFFNYNMDLRPDDWRLYRQTDEERKETSGDDAWILQMQKNPDVTIRFRGLMEKCTYCVQRINAAKIETHVAGKDLVPDGDILTACQQVCPTGALVFGDIRDPDSAVSKAKRSPRDYSVLRDLNTHPRTTYLARIRNPHPDLVSA